MTNNKRRDLAPVTPRHLMATIEEGYATLQAATSLEEVVDVRNLADLLHQIAEKANLGRELINRGGELKLRSERVMGQCLKKIGIGRGGDQKSTGRNRVTLDDLEISPRESSYVQKLSDFSDAEFDTYIEGRKAGNGDFTHTAVLRFHRQTFTKPKKKPKNPQAGEPPEKKATTAVFESLAERDSETPDDTVKSSAEEALHHVETLRSLLDELLETGSTTLSDSNRRATDRYLSLIEELLKTISGIKMT